MRLAYTIVTSTLSLLGATPRLSYGFVSRTFGTKATQATARTQQLSAAASQLEQLAGMTTLSIDSGDLKVIEEYAKTGFITDATTNPLFVSQAGLNSGDPTYAQVRNDMILFFWLVVLNIVSCVCSLTFMFLLHNISPITTLSSWSIMPLNMQ